MARNAELYPTDRRGSDSPQFGEAIDDLDERVQVVEGEGGGSGLPGWLSEDTPDQELFVGDSVDTVLDEGWGIQVGSTNDQGYAQLVGGSGFVNVAYNGIVIGLAAAGDIRIEADSGNLILHGPIVVSNVPSTDPAAAGHLWVDASAGYALKVSQG